MKKLLLLLILSLTANAGSYGELDFHTQVCLGKIIGWECGQKFGENPDVDTGTVPEDITDMGGVYVPPTTDRTHDIASTSIQDAGTLLSTGTVTSYDTATYIFTDSTADFVTDGVAVGDLVLDDTAQDHSIVTAVTNLTTLVLEPMHHTATGGSIVGDTYRVVTSAGTGSIVLHIKQGGQKAGARTSEFIILNGTTNVPTTSTYYRITRMHIHGVGTNGESVGNITATAQTDATVTAQITNGNGSTGMAFYHVPRGYTLLLYSWYATLHRTGTASDAMAKVTLNSELWKENSDGRRLWSSLGVSINGGIMSKKYIVPLKFSQDEDIFIRVKDVSDNDSHVSGGFDYILINNDNL